MTNTRARRRTDPEKSASAAVLLSFLWPGLGQLYLGRRRPAVVFAVPALVLLALLLWEARDGAEILAARLLLVPTMSFLLVVATVLLAAWRLAAMSAALLDERVAIPATSVRAAQKPVWSRQPRRTAVTFAVLAALVVGMHGVVAWTGLAFLNSLSQVYVSGGPQATPAPGQTPGDLGSLPTPYATPEPGGRINVLLIGSDGGLGYDHSLTDSLIVVTVDPVGKVVDMLSLPRDISRFPLYAGGVYDSKINSLASYAVAHPAKFPDGGFGTLTREVGYLIGAPIHYYAYVNLAGFKAVIDAVGGVDIVNPRQISDPGYQFPDGARGFFLTAGPHHLDGRVALAYVRSRNGPGDNDFTRARRQQELLIALRADMLKPNNLTHLPSILDALAKTIQTDFPADKVPDILQIAQLIPEASVTHYVLGPPYARTPAISNGTYELIIDESKFAALSIRLFGSSSRYATPGASQSP